MDICPVSLAVTITSSVLWLLVYCPIIIHHLRKYRSRRHNVVYSMRYANITVIQSIIFICKLVFGVFAMTSSFILFDRFSFEDKIIHAINAYVAAFFLYCFVWKFWLLRYNIMLNNIVMNGQWKSIINKQESATDSFYAKYRQKFGDVKYTMYVCIILAIILTTFYVLPNIFFPEFYKKDPSAESNPYFDELVTGWDYIIPFLLLLIIYATTPTFEDNFYIHKEMKYVFICLCVQYTMYYGELLIMGLLYPLDETLSKIIFGIQFQVILVVQFLTMLISVYWVNTRCEKIIKCHRYQVHSVQNSQLNEIQIVEIQPKEMIKDYSLEPSSTSPSQSELARDSIEAIMSSNKMYIEFMKHLSKEYNVECLLSFTEFYQFRQFIESRLDAKEIALEHEFLVKLPSDIPQSYIVFNDEWSDKQKVYKLYTKYIEIGAKFEINISAIERYRYHHLMEKMGENELELNDKELYDLFYPCLQEMFYLMKDTKTRFVRTPLYKKLRKCSNEHGKL